jgi:hypothetical protein
MTDQDTTCAYATPRIADTDRAAPSAGPTMHDAFSTFSLRFAELSQEEHRRLAEVHEMLTRLRESTLQAWQGYTRAFGSDAGKE